MNIRKVNIRSSTLAHYILLALSLIMIWIIQATPALGEGYARSVYPFISSILTNVSGWIPFSLGDLFIFLSIVGLLLYPIYGKRKKLGWKMIAGRMVTYLAWVYVWFYFAWGLNYSQFNFYQRTKTPYVAYTPDQFHAFLNDYIEKLNAAYIPTSELEELNKTFIHKRIIRQYKKSYKELGIHVPLGTPKVKTMMFTPLFSKMAITGYMGPFFCEFNLNGDLPISQYAETYAHELAHLLGVTSEAEANFYAYHICIRSTDASIRYCGYLSVFSHVMNNARRLMPDKEGYQELLAGVRPEILEQAISNHAFWMEKYSPAIGSVQDWIYNIYLKGNKIESGRKNYSEVVGLLISWWWKENQLHL